MRRCVFTALVAIALPAMAFGRGVAEGPPAIQIQSQSGVYISPNGDGVRDQLELSPVLPGDTTTAIKSFELTVFGISEELAGVVIWKRSEVQSERRGFFGNLFNVGEEPRVEIPDTLTWDGTYLNSPAAADGDEAADGEYIYQLVITDEEGVSARTPPMSVIVDRRAPTVGDIALSYPVFSPNGDGVRDQVTITQSGSREYRWSGRITDAAGAVVREFSWDNPDPRDPAADSPPPDFSWDGSSQSGFPVADGRYQYVLSGSDRAGNARSSRPVDILVSTRAGAVQAIPARAAFSPNGDGRADTLPVDIVLSEPEGIVGYSLTISPADAPDDVLREYAGAEPVPSSVTIDGKDSRGRTLPDGVYGVLLSVTYENGNRAESQPAEVTIDTFPPRGSVTANTGPEETEPGAVLAFGGTRKQYLDIRVSLSVDPGWVAVASIGETTVSVPLTELGITTPDFTVRWDGVGLDGKPVPDGLAALHFQNVDAAGNPGQTNELRVIKDTRSASVSLDIRGTYLSPDGDGVMDSIRIDTGYTVAELIDQFLLSVEDSRGRIIRTEYKRTPFDTFEWLGRTNGNTVVPDGEYYVNLQVIYHNGNAPVTRAGPILVDATNPAILELSAPYRLFSPDGDGERDTVTISQRSSVEDRWVGVIEDSAGVVVFRDVWPGALRSFTWNGRDFTGEVVPDGDYTYRVTATDAAGNVGSDSLTLVVDTRSAPVSQQPPDVTVSAGPTPFTPDGDGVNDRLTITAAAASENSLRSWELAITDPFGGVARRWTGSGAPRRQFSWDGRSEDGELVQSAQEYLVTLTVTDDRGNSGSDQATIAVGILVVREGLRLRIMVPSIHFAPNTPDLFAVSDADLQKNLETLRNLATVLNRYPDHQILIEGHAAHDYYTEGARKEREQREELLPLSAARAEEVRQALIILGVEKNRMKTEGIGGARPVVPHSDRVNLWKNRRVEFILERR